MNILTFENCDEYLRNNYERFTTEVEYQEDILRFKYIKKLITRYITNGESDLKERIILNHFIILVNIFGPEAVTRVTFLKMEDKLCYVKPFLELLSILPDKVYNIKYECVIHTNNILKDQIIENKLKILVGG